MKPVSIYAIVGKSRLLRNDELDRLLRGLADRTDALGPARFDGARAELSQVLDEVRTFSLTGDLRVVIVDEADAFISAHRAALERYASAPADTGIMILMCGSLPKNTRLYRIVAEVGVVVACESPKGRAVIGWLVRRAERKYGKRLGRVAAELLYEHLGDMIGALDAELEKLRTFVGQRDEIAPEDVEAATGRHRQEKIFAVTDAISDRDAAAGLAHWEQVLATDAAAPGRAVAGLAWGVRRLLEARRDWEAGTSLRVLAGRMYTDPDVLRRRLDRVSVEQLEVQQRDLLAADLALKTGASEIGAAMEKFIIKHSAGDPATKGSNREEL